MSSGYWAHELMGATFPEPKFAIPGLVAEGLTVNVGAPKVGKSWYLLGLAIAVAAGGKALGHIPVEQGEVLFLGLEDPPRRLKQRLEMVLGSEPAPSALRIETWWLSMVDGGGADLQAWLVAHPACRLVIVDVFARVRSRRKSGEDPYQADYMEAEGIKKIADDNSVAIILNHHTRKASADDYLDTVSGSQGIAAAADSVMVLRRSRGRADAELLVTGRDIEERELALRFVPEVGTWTLLGDAAEWRVSEQRRAILQALRDLGVSAPPKQISEISGVEHGVVKHLVVKMAKNELLIANGDGTYSLHSPRSPEEDEGGGETRSLYSPHSPVHPEGVNGVNRVNTPQTPDQDEPALRLIRDTFPSAEVVEEIPREEN